MSDCKPVGTPLDPNGKWERANDDETKNPFKELLGCLQYLTLTSRPDISAAFNTLSKYQSCASEIHWTGLKRITLFARNN